MSGEGERAARSNGFAANFSTLSPESSKNVPAGQPRAIETRSSMTWLGFQMKSLWNSGRAIEPDSTPATKSAISSNSGVPVIERSGIERPPCVALWPTRVA